MKTHTYQNFQFPQTTEDQTIAGHLIPKGYVNATLMAKNWGKSIKLFNRLDSTKIYIESLEKDINNGRYGICTSQETTKTLDELRKTVEGWTKVQISITTRNRVSNNLAGVWFHPELAIELAGWLNVNFKIWANRVLRLVLEDKIDSADFYYAKQQLQKEYEQKLKTLDRAEEYFLGVGKNQSKMISDLQETINNQDRKILSLNQSLTDIRTHHKKKITELEKNLSEATEKIVELGNSLTKAEKQIKAHLQRIDTVETRAKADESYLNIDDPECKYDAFLIFLHTGIKDYNYFKSVLHERYILNKDYKKVGWKKGEVRQGRYKYLVTAKTMHNLLLTFRSKEGVDSRALPEIYRKLVKEALDNNINSRELRSR